jgi:MFS family permease
MPAGREFGLLWAGRSTSELGSAIVPVALTFAVLDSTGSASALGLVLTVGFVARIVLLVPGGLVADRLPRQRVMLAADAARALTQAAVAALFLAGEPRLWMLLVLFALYGAADAFFAPASTALVPEVVDRSELQQANALLSASRNAATIAGPVLGGLLVTAAPAGTAFALDAATFAVSTVTLLFLRTAASSRPQRSRALRSELALGWREVTGRTWLWVSIVFFGLSNLAVAPLYVLGPLVARTSLGGPTSWGVILACAGAGSLAGDVAGLRLRPRRALSPGYLALASWAIAPVLLALRFPTSAVCVSAALGFAALSFSNTLWSTALQEHIPLRHLSRVSSYDWLGSRLLQPLGYALAGPAGSLVGLPAALIGGAAVHASSSLLVALVPSVRRLRRPDSTN